MITKQISTDRLKKPRKKPDQKGAVVLSYTASTSNPDRYGDIIKQNWNLDSFRKNPVVLFQHRSDLLPIGKGIVTVHNAKLLIDIEFDTDERSAEIARKASLGFLNAVSVGFNSSKGTARSELDPTSPFYAEKGMLYEEAELLEVSMVTIPANGEAVASKDLSFGAGVSKQDIIDIIRSEVTNKPITDLLMLHKHILEIEETADRYIVHFAKEEELDEELDELEDELEEELDEELEEDEEENYESLSDKENKQFTYIDHLSSDDWLEIKKLLEESNDSTK